MSDFSDAEDKMLVRLVGVYQARGALISWTEIAKKMKKSNKTPAKLVNRMKTLQNRYGKFVSNFPPWYFVTSSVRAPRKKKASVAADTPQSSEQSHAAIGEIFGHMTARDVLQKSGTPEQNVGELSPASVTDMIRLCELSTNDVFVDVGSGVGNVVAQVALESNVKAALGVEIRSSLATLSKTQINLFTRKYPRLRGVRIYPEDICHVDTTNDPYWQMATVLYCHNTVFHPAAQLYIERLCCDLPALKVVILHEPFCHRHREKCPRKFCMRFCRREKPLYTSVSYRHRKSSLHIYDRWIPQRSNEEEPGVAPQNLIEDASKRAESETEMVNASQSLLSLFDADDGSDDDVISPLQLIGLQEIDPYIYLPIKKLCKRKKNYLFDK